MSAPRECRFCGAGLEARLPLECDWCRTCHYRGHGPGIPFAGLLAEAGGECMHTGGGCFGLGFWISGEPYAEDAVYALATVWLVDEGYAEADLPEGPEGPWGVGLYRGDGEPVGSGDLIGENLDGLGLGLLVGRLRREGVPA